MICCSVSGVFRFFAFVIAAGVTERGVAQTRHFAVSERFCLRLAYGDKAVDVQPLIDELGLKDVTAIHDRAEDAARKKELRDSFDIAVSRAVAALPVLSEYMLPFVKPKGVFISYKATGAEAELSDSARAIKLLGGGSSRVYSFTLPDSDISRSFVVISKKLPTPKAYPRKAGTAKKSPL